MKIRFSFFGLCKAMAMVALASLIFEGKTGANPPHLPVQTQIFGVGVTNLENEKARLVFTTTKPARAHVIAVGRSADNEENGGHELRFSEKEPREIHDVELKPLRPGLTYRVNIEAESATGEKATSSEFVFTARQRKLEKREWPGRTLIGTGVGREGPLYLTDLTIESGARVARLEASWSHLLPARGQINREFLSTLRSTARALKQGGVEPLVVLDYCVPWAKPLTDTTMTWRRPEFGPPDSLRDWEDYVRLVMAELGRDVSYYEIWNEPDAGYLATGRFVERPGLPAPIGRAPFKDNTAYWLGDRYVPMIMSVRKIADEVAPHAILLNGGWNRDYNGTRGDLIFERGVAPYLDSYTFHTYSGSPNSYAQWHEAIANTFVRNIDRIFERHQVAMPLSVTEWGAYGYDRPDLKKGLVTHEDAQIFLRKSTFYFLSLERVELLVQYSLGFGPTDPQQHPYEMMMINRAADGTTTKRPKWNTFAWLTKNFSNRPYRALKLSPQPNLPIRAYAVEMEGGEIFLALWQEKYDRATRRPTPMNAARYDVPVAGISPADYEWESLDLTGQSVPDAPKSDNRMIAVSDRSWTVSLDAVTSDRENKPLVLRGRRR